jgi:hypothetical protein
MYKTACYERFSENVQRGRRFEREKRAQWGHIPGQRVHIEARTEWKGKRGRIDIRIDEDDGSVSIIELKATDWDSVKPHRLRATAHRHARQVWRYINDHFASATDVNPGIVYAQQPKHRQTYPRISD